MKHNWDWEPGKRIIQDTNKCSADYEWMQEFYTSSDGEKIAAIVHLGQAEFTLCVNGQTWENTFDNIWSPKFSPDGRLTALVSSMGEWTVAVDDQPWEEQYGFLWDLQFSTQGEVIAAAAQQNMNYGMVRDGQIWENLYSKGSDFCLSSEGNKTAAVVQKMPLDEGDIETFQKGVFSVAVEGEPWEQNFINVWKPVFDPKGDRIAAQVRTSLYDYSIAVDGKTWADNYSCVWEPVFDPASGKVIAPVRLSGKWGLAGDAELLWQPRYNQLWHQQISPDGQIIAAIVAPDYGNFTVAVNDKPWSKTYSLVNDLTLSPDGSRAAAVGSENVSHNRYGGDMGETINRWQIIADGVPWQGWYDMVYPPVFSQDGKHLAAKVENKGKFTVILDDKAYPQEFSMLWDPIFSPESDKLLIRALDEQGRFLRIVAKIQEFKA
jgi:Tol biopolymer transport system component